MALNAQDLHSYRERLLVEMSKLSRTDLTQHLLHVSLQECGWLITRCHEVIPASEYTQFKSQQKMWLRSTPEEVTKSAAACLLMLKSLLETIDSKAGQLSRETSSIPLSSLPGGAAHSARNYSHPSPLRKPGAVPVDETWRSQAALLHAKVDDLEKQREALYRTIKIRDDQLAGKDAEIAFVSQKLAGEQAENSGLRGQLERLMARISAQDERRPAELSKVTAKPVQTMLPLALEQLSIADLEPAPAAKTAPSNLTERLIALEANVAELKRRRAVAV